MSENFPEVVDVVDAECVEDSTDIIELESVQEEIKLKPKYRIVAELALHGYPLSEISKKMNLTDRRIRQILKSGNVIAYINRSIQSMFEESDRLLARLYQKALFGLEKQLEDSSPDMRDKAMDKIIKLCGYKSDDSKHTSVTIFNQNQSSSSLVNSIDEIILAKRRDRGLEK